MYKFAELTNAQSFVNRASKIWMIVLGDDGKYWVVTPKEAARLERQGYEVL